MSKKPAHPGEVIQSAYLKRHHMSCRELAGKLDVAASTLNRILTGKIGVSTDMALRLSKCIGRTPEAWLNIQQKHDLFVARKHANLKNVQKI
jgi:addiction module HigA family antidote